MLEVIKENWSWVLEKTKAFPKQHRLQFFLLLLSTFVIIPILTLASFTIYMRVYDFFSYDFFEEGVFGMNLFFMTSCFALVVLSVFMWATVWVVICRKKIDHFWSIFWISLACMFVFLSMYFYKVNDSNNWPAGITLAILTFIISVHIGLSVLGKKGAVLSLSTILTVYLYLGVNFPEVIAGVVGIGVQAYGAGQVRGKVEFSKGEPIIGEIKLISPKNIYMIPDGEACLMTISLSKVERYQLQQRNNKKASKVIDDEAKVECSQVASL